MAEAETIELAAIKCGEKTAVHNNRVWIVRTNRHPTTGGSSWGWIEGPTEHVCWSNDNAFFDINKAEEVCRIHNQWVENQKSIDLRINECGQKTLANQREWQSRQQAADYAWRKYQESLSHLRDLQQQKSEQA